MDVELLDFYGDDLMIVNAARGSYDKQKEILDEKDIKLLKFLQSPPTSPDTPHWAPFAHPQLTFRVKCSIVCERQLFKHKISVVDSSLSGRYIDFSDRYDMPTQLRYQSKDSKQGSAGDLPPELNDKLIRRMKEVTDLAQIVYAELETAGVAKEQCRYVCPMGLETTFVRTMSFYAFVNMSKLRLKPDTQKETRDIVAEMLELVKRIPKSPFQYSLEVWGL